MQDMEYNVSLPSATVLQLEAAKPPSLIHTESSFTGCILKIENSQKFCKVKRKNVLCFCNKVLSLIFFLVIILNIKSKNRTLLHEDFI